MHIDLCCPLRSTFGKRCRPRPIRPSCNLQTNTAKPLRVQRCPASHTQPTFSKIENHFQYFGSDQHSPATFFFPAAITIWYQTSQQKRGFCICDQCGAVKIINKENGVEGWKGGPSTPASATTREPQKSRPCRHHYHQLKLSTRSNSVSMSIILKPKIRCEDTIWIFSTT